MVKSEFFNKYNDKLILELKMSSVKYSLDGKYDMKDVAKHLVDKAETLIVYDKYFEDTKYHSVLQVDCVEQLLNILCLQIEDLPSYPDGDSQYQVSGIIVRPGGIEYIIERGPDNHTKIEGIIYGVSNLTVNFPNLEVFTNKNELLEEYQIRYKNRHSVVNLEKINRESATHKLVKDEILRDCNFTTKLASKISMELRESIHKYHSFYGYHDIRVMAGIKTEEDLDLIENPFTFQDYVHEGFSNCEITPRWQNEGEYLGKNYVPISVMSAISKAYIKDYTILSKFSKE